MALVFTRATNTVQFYIDGMLRTTATKALETDGATHVVTIGNHAYTKRVQRPDRRSAHLQPSTHGSPGKHRHEHAAGSGGGHDAAGAEQRAAKWRAGAGTTQTTLSVTSNENATCRYATTAGTAYASMPNTFGTTGGTAHSTLVAGWPTARATATTCAARTLQATPTRSTWRSASRWPRPTRRRPRCGVSAPAAGATVSGTVSVSASASDNVGVVGVQFLLDGANLGAEDTAAPYTVSWNTTGAANGAHTLSARARDAAGNQTTSAVVWRDGVQCGARHDGADGERERAGGRGDGTGTRQRERQRQRQRGRGGRAVPAGWRQPRSRGHGGTVHG